MNKFHVLLLITIIFVFGAIIFSTQKDYFMNKSELQADTDPSLPPTGDELKFISPPSTNNQAPSKQKTDDQRVQGSAIQGPINASVSATIKTTKGDVSVILFGKEAPNTVANFINKSKSNYYKNLTFHRVEDWVVQGGDPEGNGTGGSQMLAEQSSKPFTEGSLGIARGSDPRINKDSQFFFTKKDADWLNGQYTNFGIETSGMSVVNSIKIGDKILGITIQ